MNHTQRVALRLLFGFLIGSVILGMSGPTATQGSGPVRVYLPILASNNAVLAGRNRSIFGVEIIYGWAQRVAPQLRELNPDWVRFNGVLWSDVEPQPGARNWDALIGVDLELQAISSVAPETMLVIRGAPAWAQQVPGKICGPIKPEALPAFAAFVGEVVARYSQPPYNVKYWEFGNEPDVDAALVDSTSPFGCWGDAKDPYYGGGRYAEMLAAVYPVIKAADPEAQVVLGGLLLDCDPGQPPAGKDCLPAKFLEGILRAGGGEHFDIAAYHAYMYWGDVELDWDVLFPAWSHRGGSLLGKLDFVRSTLAAYGYVKPVIMNEGSLLCRNFNPSCGPNGFYDDQANYVLRMYARSAAADLVASIWFPLNGPGFNDSGLLNRDQSIRPAYRALQFLIARLRDGVYVDGSIDGSLEQHRFRVGNTLYTFVWSNDSSVIAYPLPADTRAVYNALGEPLPLPETLEIDFQPLLIESGG